MGRIRRSTRSDARALLVVGLLGCGGGFETRTELPAKAERRPDGVALEPVSALPPAREHAPAAGVVALRQPVSDKDVEDVVRAYLRAFEREDEPALLQLLGPDAVPLGRPNGGTRQMLVEQWRQKLRSFDYQRLAGMEIARLGELERRGVEAMGGPNEPPRPPEMRPGDLWVKVPIALPRLGEPLFGDYLVLLLRREDGRLRIAGQADQNAP